jgi:hypothetical protein
MVSSVWVLFDVYFSQLVFSVNFTSDEVISMFNRRMFVALACCLAVSASSAFAGGSGGAKKDSTIKVVNQGSNPVYAFVDVAQADIATAAAKADPIAAFKALGGKQIAAGKNSALFQVKAGAHKVSAVDIVAAVPVVLDKPITTTKGKTSVVDVP